MKNVIKKWWPAAAGVVFTFILAFALHLIRVNLAEVADYPNRSFESNEVLVDIEVSQGELGLEIANELFDKGVTASVTAFYQLAINDSRSMKIAPGIHQLNQEISASQALDQLLDPNRNVGLISIIEGMWRSEIFKEMESAGFKGASDALSAIELPAGFEFTEGIFFPAQYSFAKGTSTKSALQAMVTRFAEEAEQLGLRDKSDLIVASIIQAEGDPADFKRSPELFTTV